MMKPKRDKRRQKLVEQGKLLSQVTVWIRPCERRQGGAGRDRGVWTNLANPTGSTIEDC